MPKSSANTVLQYLRSLVAGKKAEGQSDQHLLRQFVSQHDETAFAALVERHGPMAMGVCLRILRDQHLAEDAFQATFLVLAVKASSLCRRGFVPSWLYGVALRLSRKLKAQTSRFHQPIARQNGQLFGDASMEAIRREEEEVLDDEIRRLPEKYRLPLLLCYFEGLTQKEAAERLGWTEGKVRALLARGRDRLRFRLIRRGLALSAAGPTVLAGTSLSAAVPKPLTAATVQAAVHVISGKTLTDCGVSAAVAILAKGGLSMSANKVLLILGLLLLTGAIAVAAGMWSRPGEVQPLVLTEKVNPMPNEVPIEQEKENIKQKDKAAQEKNGPRLVDKILETDAIDQLSNPPNLAVAAVGQVPTSGYTNVRLLRARYETAPEDGIQDYFLLATPPAENAAQVISKVSSRNVWKKYTKEAPKLKGYRVHGAAGALLAKDGAGEVQEDKNGPRIVGKILKIDFTFKDSNPGILFVTAVGQVPTGGYTNVRLLRAIYPEPPTDGIQDYFLLAVPPAELAAQVVSEVQVEDRWGKWDEKWLKGVRVHGADSGVVVKKLYGK